MQFTVIGPKVSRTGSRFFAAAMLSIAFAMGAAFPALAGGTVSQLIANPTAAFSGEAAPSSPLLRKSPAAAPTIFAPTPETAAPLRSASNYAQSLQIGQYNQSAQIQSGQNNFSNLGIIGGSRNSVGVVQGGNDFSNLYLVNTKGLSVGVLQPNGAAPINMLIARLPSGALLIKR